MYNPYRQRKIFRPRSQQLGDRFFGRDYAYWQRQMGLPQRPFFRQFLGTRQQRARNVPWMSRHAFAAMYGPDADYDQWLVERRFRQDDLNDPVVFANLVDYRMGHFGQGEDDPRFNANPYYPGRGNRNARGEFMRPYAPEVVAAMDEAARELDLRADEEEAIVDYGKRQRWDWEDAAIEAAGGPPEEVDPEDVVVKKKAKFEDPE